MRKVSTKRFLDIRNIRRGTLDEVGDGARLVTLSEIFEVVGRECHEVWLLASFSMQNLRLVVR
jgi:hypothetical protein